MRRKGLALGALVLGMAVLLGVWLWFRPVGTAGEKEVDIQVVYSEAEHRDFHLTTEAEYLGEALKEAELIEGEEGPYGLFITTVDGVRASESRQEWWCVTKEGQRVDTGVDSTPIANGDRFELTLTAGY